MLSYRYNCLEEFYMGGRLKLYPFIMVLNKNILFISFKEEMQEKKIYKIIYSFGLRTILI